MMTANYADKKAFETYVDYLALKRHFTGNYDYFKYNGQVKASFDSFQTRRDVFFFSKLSKRPEKRDILVANLLHNQKAWIGEIMDETVGIEIYRDWKKRFHALTYNFQIEIRALDEDYKKNFVIRDGQHPHLLKLMMERKISFETFTIIAHIANVLDSWEAEVEDTFIAKGKFSLARKYRPFLEIDEKKFKTILKDHFF